ncbi:MAG: Eukaryotic-type DNA primase [Methanophagales archaeon]|nr:DNA primase large subunit PriL [Methanophagales archaeon]MCU4139495.1 Eukaryotic-type DNA primase [Methanophagales archaeon]
MDKKTLSLFPFTREASLNVQSLGVSLDALVEDDAFERARIRGKERVIEAIERGEVSKPLIFSDLHAEIELLSYPFARILVSCIGDSALIERFALAEAKGSYEKLKRLSSSKDDFALALAEDFSLNVSPAEESASATRRTGALAGQFKMHFTDFLRLSAGLSGLRWKLVNRDLRDGFVLLNRSEFLRLLQSAFYMKVRERLPLEVPAGIRHAVMKYTEEIKRVWERVKSEAFKRGSCGGEDMKGIMDVSCFPPCISRILSGLLAGENISHAGRFALTAFLLNIGMKPEEVMQLYKNAPDFNASRTKYQVEHIAGSKGTKYISPSCDTLRTYGLCVKEEDEICKEVSHPLKYYARKLHLKKRVRAKEKEGQGKREERLSSGVRK